MGRSPFSLHHDSRRFVVMAPFLEFETCSFGRGDVVTDRALGGFLTLLLQSGVVREGDYLLAELFDDIDAAPSE